MARKCTSPYFGSVCSNAAKCVLVQVSRWKIRQTSHRISWTLTNAPPGTVTCIGLRGRIQRYLPATFLFEFQLREPQDANISARSVRFPIFQAIFSWMRLAKGRRFGRRVDDQVSCIIATENQPMTPAKWGENPIILGRNLTIAGPPIEEDEEKSEDACRVHPSGEIQFLVGDQRDYLFAQTSNRHTSYSTFQNIRLSALMDAALGDDFPERTADSSAGQSGFDAVSINLGFNIIGLGFQDLDTNVRRGFIADNMHVISDCGKGRFP
eukprot:383986-Prorocentrum_minimum.AAC.1